MWYLPPRNTIFTRGPHQNVKQPESENIKNKRALVEVDIYLKSTVENKTFRRLQSFSTAKQLFIAHAACNRLKKVKMIYNDLYYQK